MKNINSKDFKDNIKNGIVLVDMFADWCGPCRALSPILDEVQEEYEQKGVKFFKLDVDESNDIAQEYGVMSIPAVFIFKDGEVVKRIDGLYPKATYIDVLREILSE